jgi:hypothetical protein
MRANALKFFIYESIILKMGTSIKNKNRLSRN